MQNHSFNFLTLLILLTLNNLSFAQSEKDKVNSDNYYEYRVTPVPGQGVVSTDWIRRNEAVPIIIEELEKLGLKISPYVLYELEDGNKIILEAYNRQNDIGLVFNTGHLLTVKKEQRDTRTFNQDGFKYGGSLSRRSAYKELPQNIVVLQETWYWYQYTDDQSIEIHVDKETAMRILREDISAFIKELTN
jgi:hypothetical protein